MTSCLFDEVEVRKPLLHVGWKTCRRDFPVPMKKRTGPDGIKCYLPLLGLKTLDPPF